MEAPAKAAVKRDPRVTSDDSDVEVTYAPIASKGPKAAKTATTNKAGAAPATKVHFRQ
jgi:hypothetical protein